jgi:hypothetical protein
LGMVPCGVSLKLANTSTFWASFWFHLKSHWQWWWWPWVMNLSQQKKKSLWKNGISNLYAHQIPSKWKVMITLLILIWL